MLRDRVAFLLTMIHVDFVAPIKRYANIAASAIQHFAWRDVIMLISDSRMQIDSACTNLKHFFITPLPAEKFEHKPSLRELLLIPSFSGLHFLRSTRTRKCSDGRKPVAPRGKVNGNSTLWSWLV